MSNGDTFKRVAVDKDRYQCGCHWLRSPIWGDQLSQCPIHGAATVASVREFDRERSAQRRGSGT
jgi:hypothetical protein